MGPDGWDSIGQGIGSVWNTITGAWKAAGEAAAGIGNAVSFATDPIGFLTNAFGGAAKFILATVIPWALKALTPDFSAAWFLKQYAIVFSVAIITWGLVFMIGLIRKRLSPSQVADLIAVGSPTFFVGCLIAPWGMFVVGGLIMTITNALSVWMTGQNVDTFVTQVGTLVTNGDTLALLPEPLIALGLVIFLALSAVTMFLVLLMGLVVSYMTGGLFPLAWVWITLPETRRTAWLMVMALIAIWCAPILIILSIGLATQMAANYAFQATQKPGDAMAVVLAICVPAIGMLMASLAPMMLGVMAASRVSPAGTAGLSSGFGRDNLMNRLPQPSASRPKSAGQVADTQPSAPSSPSSSPSSTSLPSASPSTAMAPAGSDAATAAAGTGAKAASTAATAETAGATAATAGAGASGSAGAGAAGATAAAGAGTTATGVGAAVGVPLLVGAAVLAAANGGKQKARAFASALAEMGQM